MRDDPKTAANRSEEDHEDGNLNGSGERFQNNAVSVTGFTGSRVNGRPIGVKKYAISGFVWTSAIRSNSCVLQLKTGKLLFGVHSSKSLQ